MTSDYCREACGPTACEDCPRPRVLPDAAPAVLAYQLCQTQWNVGMSGITGLRYESCLPLLDRKAAHFAAEGAGHLLPDVEEAFGGLQVIEAAMLSAAAEIRERASANAKTQRTLGAMSE